MDFSPVDRWIVSELQRTEAEVAERLRKEFDLNEEDCYRVHGSVNLGRYAKIIELVERPDLLFPPFTETPPMKKAPEGA